MIDDERTVDEIVDEFFADEDEGVREEKTEAAGDGHKKPRIYLNRCRDCRTTFETPYVGGKYCPACKRKRISEGQKARQARERQERAAGAAANDRQVKSGNTEEPKEAETMEKDEKTVAEAWKSLGEPETEASKDPAAAAERESHLREPREVLMDLYSTVRSLARAAGLDPSRTIEALWEVDSIFGNVGSVGRA